MGLLIRILVITFLVMVAQEPRALIASQALVRGDKAFQQGRVTQAITEYRAALEAQPGEAIVLRRLVDSTLAANLPDLAGMFLKQLSSQYGWTPELCRRMADVLLAQGDRRQAAIYLQASLTGSRDDGPALHKLIDFGLADRDWHTTIERLKRLIDIDPTDEHALYQLGLLLAPTDTSTALVYLERAAVDPQYRDAVAAVQSAVSAYRQDTPAALSFQIGLALMNLRLWPYAEHALVISLEQGTNTPSALAFLGITQDQQGLDGWPLIDRAFAIAPTDPMVNYAVALHWRTAGDAQKAMVALARAQALDPRNPAIAAEVGLVYQMVGRLSDAAFWLNMAVSLAPDHPGFRTLLATFYADSNYNLAGEGLQIIQNLAALSPNDPDIRASLGWALFSTGQFDAARVELEKALVLDPINVRARYYFGAFLEYRGDHEGAIDAYLYVYRNNSNTTFRGLAGGALKRLGYTSGTAR